MFVKNRDMIQNKVLLLNKPAKLQNGLEFPAGTEFHIVMDVLYMKGFPVPAGLQATIVNWINANPKLFTEINRG